MSLFGQTKNTTSLLSSGSPSTRFDVNYNGNPMLSQTPGDVLATGASHPGWVSQGNYISAAPVAATGTNGSTVGPGNSLSDLFNTYWWVFAAAAVLILFLLFVK